MIDDRLPVVLVILDGLGDRASAELDGLTPAEAARTPVLDQLCAGGVNGVHVPFGPGRSTSSETSHWSLFGFDSIPFPGRAALEALGVGQCPPEDTALFHFALRNGELRDGALYLGARARRDQDEDEARELFAALDGRERDGIRFKSLPLRCGECVLAAEGALTRDVSDSDALFDHIHPWMRPLPLADSSNPEAARAFATTLEHWLLEGREILLNHPINHARRERGLPTLDTPVTKWASWIDPTMPSFSQQVGFAGAAVTDTALYRGLARILDMTTVDIAYNADAPREDMLARLQAASELMDKSGFVHVHVKATDEAGHTKKPPFKRDIIEATDAGLAPLLELRRRAIVAVTGDHATPSVSSLLHSGDPTPLVIAGPGIRPDSVTTLGEKHALSGQLGHVSAADVLPLMIGYANRPFFLGHRPGPWASLALPDSPDPMPV